MNFWGDPVNMFLFFLLVEMALVPMTLMWWAKKGVPSSLSPVWAEVQVTDLEDELHSSEFAGVLEVRAWKREK